MRQGVRLAVDVGTVRVGLAASDPSGLLASPVATLPRDAKRATDLARIVTETLERAAIEIIVGLPLHLSGREGPSAALARRYAAEVAHRVAPVPVRLVDERLSTVSATAALAASGRRGRGARQVVDQAAAVVVLQAALDAERVTGRPPGSMVEPGPGEPV